MLRRSHCTGWRSPSSAGSQRRARARVAKTVESVSEEWLHLFNLPAATDLLPSPDTHGLTLRQLEVITMLGRGFSNKEIARALDVAERVSIGERLGQAPLQWGPPNGYPDVAGAWNSAHATPGCSIEELRKVGGEGYFYCFAAK